MLFHFQSVYNVVQLIFSEQVRKPKSVVIYQKDKEIRNFARFEKKKQKKTALNKLCDWSFWHLDVLTN